MPGAGQRRPGPALGGGPDAGPEAGAEVVGVGAGDDVGDAEPRGQRREDVDQLGLAERAAVAGVGAVALAGELVGARDSCRTPREATNSAAAALGRREARRDGGGRDDPVGASARTAAASTTPESTPPENATSTPGSGRELGVQRGQAVVERAHVAQVLTGGGKPTVTRAESPASSTRATSRPSGSTAACSPGAGGRDPLAVGERPRLLGGDRPGRGTPWSRPRPAAGRRRRRPRRAPRRPPPPVRPVDGERPRGGAPQRGEVPAHAEGRPGVAGDGPDVGAGGARDGHVDVDQVGPGRLIRCTSRRWTVTDRGASSTASPRAHPVVGPAAVDLHRAHRRRHLLQRAGLGGQRRRTASSSRCAVDAVVSTSPSRSSVTVVWPSRIVAS